MRPDTFSERRKHLAGLSEEELHDRFWRLANEIVVPLVELAKTYTSPSIERSVLLRMGFSSIETGQLVRRCLENSLLGKGAGHVVLRWAQKQGTDIRQAGLELLQMENWKPVKELFSQEVGTSEDSRTAAS